MLVVGVTGNGDTTLNNAAALLDDYLPVDDVLVYVPSYITSDGMRVVVQWLKDNTINIERVKKNELKDNLLSETNSVLIVLGIAGSEELIADCLAAKMPVLDLTRGLYQVTEAEIALDSAESEPETQTDESPAPVGESKDLGSPSLTALPWSYDITGRIMAEIDILREKLGMERINWEHTADPRMPIAPYSKKDTQLSATFLEQDHNEEAVANEVYKDLPSKEKYFQNGKGKIRKAGRSKIKPGEKEVWLTEDEANELINK